MEFDVNGTFFFYISGLAVLGSGLMVGLVSTWHSNMFKTFLRHPSIFVLPMFSSQGSQTLTELCVSALKPLS